MITKISLSQIFFLSFLKSQLDSLIDTTLVSPISTIQFGIPQDAVTAPILFDITIVDQYTNPKTLSLNTTTIR